MKPKIFMQLERIVEEKWNRIDFERQDYLQKLVLSMPRRLQDVIDSSVIIQAINVLSS